MPRYAFFQVDVFTDRAFGQPAGRVPRRGGLDTDQMQRIAAR